MRKFLGIFLTVALTASMLVGCGSSATEEAPAADAAAEETAAADGNNADKS